MLRPTDLTRGPWDPAHQHAGPPSALLVRAIEEQAQIAAGALARISVDILRPVPVAPVVVSARTLRPGRRVEQIEATLAAADGGTTLMRATAWRVRAEPVTLPDGLAKPDPPPPWPDDPAPPDLSFWRDEVAYHAALEWRFAHGGFTEPGPAAVWTRLRVPLVAGEPTTPLQHLLVMADAASGISTVLDWTRWIFINVDFNVHLERLPEGEWVAMDAVTRPGPAGAGVCTSVLHDRSGRVGMSTQSLLVGPR